MIFFAEGLVKGCLNDRDVGMSAWVSGPGMGAVLEALERGLQEDRLEWRKNKPLPRNQRK